MSAPKRARGGDGMRGDAGFLERIVGGDALAKASADGGGEAPVWRRAETWGGAFAVLSGAAAAALWKMSGGGGAAASFILLSAAAGAGAAWWSYRRREARLIPRLLMAAVETTPDARLISTPDGQVLYANPAFGRLFAAASAGAGDGDEASSLSQWFKRLAGDDGPASIHALSSHVADGAPFAVDGVSEFARLVSSAEAGVPDHAEIPFRSAGGAVEWRRIAVQPLGRDARRGLILPGPRGGRYALWRGEDVTARREFESMCRRDAETMADLLGNLPSGFFSADGDGRVVFMNGMLAQWLGVDADQVNRDGRRFAEFVVSVSPMPVAASGGPAIGEITLRRADGGTFRALLVQSERTGAKGEPVYSRSLVLRDLSRRDGESGDGVADRLRWLFDASPVGIVMTDMAGNAVDCNAAYLTLTGGARNDVLGRPIADTIAIDDRAEVASQLSKLVMGTMPAASLDVRIPAPGKREVVANLHAMRMVDDDGDGQGILLHFIDTTEQKHLEMQFAQSQKMQAVGQLAGGVAHDFNNLLTAMIGFCDLLLGRHGPDDPSFADIMQIKQNANRATNLVRQLLAFSRREAHQPVAVDVAEALSDLAGLLGRLLGENVSLSLEPSRGASQVFVDRGQFDQIIINLAVNARDAMPKGGVLTIRVGGAAPAAPMARGPMTVPPGDYVTIDVIDTGVGIPRDILDRIFEPFFSTKEVGQGTGLGLSTVYGIVSQAGGVVTVDSAPGEGAAFSIYLPRYTGSAAIDGTPSRASGETAAEAPPAATDLTGAGTVLIVEDEDAVRMFGARALKSKGYTVLEARNGEEAIDVINSAGASIDLIVSDVVMPGMDGHTLVKLVRQEFPEVKVILMSGYAEDVFRDEIDRDGAVAFLPKPFSLKDLAGKVKDVLES